MNSPPPTQPSSGLYTSCPACLRQFSITATQLSAANGTVVCGACEQQFNALSRLQDAPVPIDQLQRTDTPELTPGSNIDNRTITAKDSQTQQQVTQDQRTHELLHEINQDITHLSPGHVPEYAPKNTLLTVGFAIGTTLLIIIIAMQLAWFNRDALLARYPQLLPIVQKLCDRFDCPIFKHKDIGAIKLVNRDVRHHPLYEDALLINVTIVSHANKVQSFPFLQLALFNTNGKAIAYREFKPDEYVRRGTNINTGMVPKQPVHFMLEVIGPTQEAVSFEFNFI